MVTVNQWNHQQEYQQPPHLILDHFQTKSGGWLCGRKGDIPAAQNTRANEEICSSNENGPRAAISLQKDELWRFMVQLSLNLEAIYNVWVPHCIFNQNMSLLLWFRLNLIRLVEAAGMFSLGGAGRAALDCSVMEEDWQRGQVYTAHWHSLNRVPQLHRLVTVSNSNTSTVIISKNLTNHVALLIYASTYFKRKVRRSKIQDAFVTPLTGQQWQRQNAQENTVRPGGSSSVSSLGPSVRGSQSPKCT